MKIKNTCAKGFTLLEVMLAMAVFAVAGVAIISTAENNFRHMGAVEEKMFANMVAANQLVEASIGKTWPPKNKLKGEIEMSGRTWYWQQNVIKTFDENMRSVEIEIRLDKAQEKPLAMLMTYVSKES